MTSLDARIRAVARRIVTECAAVRPGEHVYIDGRLDSAAYLEQLAHECELAGATALVVARSDERMHRRLTELAEGQLAATSRCELEAVKAADVVFVVRMEDGDPRLFADVSPGQRAAQSRGRKPIIDAIFGGGKRWIGTDFPTPAQAAAFNLEWDAFSEMFWRSLDVDYGELQEKADAAARLFEGARQVRIRSPKGTDVTLGVAGRPSTRTSVSSVARPTCRTCRPARSAWRRSKTRPTARSSSISPSGTDAASRTSRCGSSAGSCEAHPRRLRVRVLHRRPRRLRRRRPHHRRARDRSQPGGRCAVRLHADR